MSPRSYYETIQRREDFQREAPKLLSFKEFMRGDNVKPVNRWGSEGLVACRVLCSAESSRFRLLKPHMRKKLGRKSNRESMQVLIDGPGGDISDMTDEEKVGQAPDRLIGAFWDRLFPATFRMSARKTDPLDVEPNTPRPERKTKKPDRCVEFVSSMEIRSSTSLSSDDSKESAGYVEKVASGEYEMASLRLLEAFASCVLCY